LLSFHTEMKNLECFSGRARGLKIGEKIHETELITDIDDIMPKRVGVHTQH